jgi:hypothetical protein
MATDLVVNIASQFLGKKAFLDADKATKKLTGSVKSLGRVLGVSLSAAAFVAFGKSAVNSFTGAQKEAATLANTVKNLGLAFDQQNIDQYINKIGKLYGVTGGQATPAFQALLTVTGSTAKSIEIFNTALDVAAANSVDVTEAAQDLSQAYIGNTKALKKYDIGLTTAELAAMSFNELQTKLNNNFAGAATAAAATYTGQLAILSETANKAKEIIGESLVNAITSVGGNDGIANLGTDIENAAKSLANFIDSVVYLKEQIATIPGAGIVKGAFGLVGNVLGRFSPQRAAELLKEIKGPQPFSQPMTLANQATGVSDAAARKKAELEAIKRNKELAKLAKTQAAAALATTKAKKEQAKLDKAIAAGQLALGKGADVFDMDKIQINAALIGQAEALGKAESAAQVLSIANDIQRLKVKQSINELEDAIASKDVARIERATKQLNEDLKILGTLQSQNFTLLGIKTVLDSLKPKELIDQENLNMALDKIREMLRLLAQAGATPSTRAKSGIPEGDYVAPVVFDPNTSIDAVIEYADAATERATAFAILQEQENYAAYLSLIEFQRKLGDFGGYSADMNRGAGYGSGSTVTVEIIDKTSGLIEVVQTAVQENNRFGNNLNFAGAI